MKTIIAIIVLSIGFVAFASAQADPRSKSVPAGTLETITGTPIQILDDDGTAVAMLDHAAAFKSGVYVRQLGMALVRNAVHSFDARMTVRQNEHFPVRIGQTFHSPVYFVRVIPNMLFADGHRQSVSLFDTLSPDGRSAAVAFLAQKTPITAEQEAAEKKVKEQDADRIKAGIPLALQQERNSWAGQVQLYEDHVARAGTSYDKKVWQQELEKGKARLASIDAKIAAIREATLTVTPTVTQEK